MNLTSVSRTGKSSWLKSHNGRHRCVESVIATVCGDFPGFASRAASYSQWWFEAVKAPCAAFSLLCELVCWR